MSAMLHGFGNYFESEAIAGALPHARNSPQRPAFGLYTEQLSGTAFTAPRADNRRSWVYRLRPSAMHGAFTPLSDNAPRWHATPNRLRWSPKTMPDDACDWLDSLEPMLANGSCDQQAGVMVSRWAATRDMDHRIFFNADGELLLVPEQGAIRIETELGVMTIAPLEIALIPRGLRFRVKLIDTASRGYLVENRGQPFRLPELGPIGANGLASPRDFETPSAWYEDREARFELVQKYGDRLWHVMLDHSPLDVVAWHGTLAPCRYDLRRFNTINSVSFDHPDPSLFTLLTSPGPAPGTANADFVIFPPRWMVAEDTFRPPWFHRNIMSEAMGLISGTYDAKTDGFAPGALSLHNQMAAHGPDLPSWQTASTADLQPQRIADTMAFMVESCWPYQLHDAALASAQPDYDAIWSGFPKAKII